MIRLPPRPRPAERPSEQPSTRRFELRSSSASAAFTRDPGRSSCILSAQSQAVRISVRPPFCRRPTLTFRSPRRLAPANSAFLNHEQGSRITETERCQSVHITNRSFIQFRQTHYGIDLERRTKSSGCRIRDAYSLSRRRNSGIAALGSVTPAA